MKSSILIVAFVISATLGCRSNGQPTNSSNKNSAESVRAKVSVGMAYSAIHDLLGEPDVNVGFGELHVAWELDDGTWFVPEFDGDKLRNFQFENESFHGSRTSNGPDGPNKDA